MTKEAMQEFNQIEEELNAIVVDGKKAAEAYQQEVDAAVANKEEATQAAIKAKQNGDADAYIKASQEMRNAQDMEQFYLDKLDEIKDDPYITEVDSSKIKSRITSELDSLNRKKKAKAGELLKQLIEIREEAIPVMDKGDSVLRKLNHEVLRDAASSDDRYGDRTLIQWIDMIARQYPTQQLMECANKGGN